MLLYIKILATKSDRAVTYNITYLNPTVTRLCNDDRDTGSGHGLKECPERKCYFVIPCST